MATGTGNKALPRTRARLGAVQALYQMELADTDLSDIFAEYGAGAVARGFEELSEPDGGVPDESAKDAEPGVGGDDFEFFRDVVAGVVREQRAIDPKINSCLAQGWRLERLDSILRAILRAGTYELAHRADVPARVVINEYLDVAHAFFEGDEPKFVNGVLDRLARQVREPETVR